MEFLVALATGVVTKLGESLVAPITNQFAYIIRYKRNVKNLESQRKELEGKKLGVQATVDADKRNSHQIASNVEDWLCKVDTIENELQGFYEDDEQVKNKYLNLVSCYSLSKRAKKLSNDIIRLKEEKFEIISYPKPPPRLGSRFLNGTSIKSFQTRESIMCEVIDKLKDEDVNRISICGMGGVGKTTFVKEVIKILEADKSFDEVVMAVVSQTPDCRKIQGQIADAIGLKLDKETDQGRALQLHDRLKNIDSVLIVLDDVWTDLDFESIGIPSTSCKILFTSRIQDVCIKMKSQRNFTVSVLSRDESWDLFNETIGVNLAEKPDIHDIAKEIANQCRGLPIAIVTIAKALANKEKHAWEDALEQLRNSTVESFPEMQTSVFSCIELSYNFLGGEEKFFLFLCSLLPEDFDIPIEVLFRHGVGLGMFKGIDALWKVRNRVHTIVDRLKECFMLLDSNVEECVKMHDVVRDTIASIAAKYHHHLDCYSSAISLIFEKKTELLHVSNCQKLKLLQVSSKGKESVPENFFQGMNKLMVLSLQNVLIQSMPSTLSALDNIHTLRLEACNVGDISIIGQKLMKLEILSFAKSSIKLQELPNLTAFIKTSIMHQHHSPYKQVQESNTLLENFIEHDQEFLGEDMFIGSALFESNSLQLFPKLEKILLRACSSLNIVFDMKPSQLEDQHVDNAAFFAQLKELELSWLNNLNHIWGSVPSNIQGFHKLKSIKVANCDSLKYIFTPSIVRALTQLEKLVIQSCMSLEKFVGNEQGQHVETLVFVQLESLTLKDLPQLVNFGPNSYMILWPAMKSLCIDGCPLLKASNVCVQEENFNVISNSITSHDVGTTTSMEDSPSLRFLQCCFGGTKELLVSNSKAKALKMEEGVVDAKEINFFNEMGGSPMPILEHVIIKGWDSLDVLFHLKQSEDSNNTIVVNCLVKLMTMQLPSSPLGVIAFNNITLLSLEGCHRLRYICSYSIAKLLVKLQEIKVSNCKVVEQLFQSEEHEICVDYLEWPSLKRISVINCSMLEVVISKVEEGKINSFIITSFAQLQSLTLTHLPNVISFCNNTFLENGHGNEYFKQDHERASSSEEERNTRLDAPLINGFQFPNLRHIAIMGCNKMSCLFSPSTSKSLVHLQVLEICGCGDIEEIVSFEDTNKVMSVISNKFVFHNLQHLKLENLPKLKAFCKGSYDFDFPLLHEVFLKNCHMMEIFSCGSSYTPKLDKVTMEIGNVAKNIWMGDLNATMPLCKGMLTFQSSETLRWIKQHSWALRYLTKEKELTIEGFQRLLNLVPSNVMHLFQNLNQLTIKDCDSLVEVFESQGIIMMNKKEVTNYELQSMSLQHLPKLTHIWRFHGGVLGFKKLRVLKVEHCGSLCSLFSPSMAKSLVQLWHLRVHNCHMMEEIIEESSSSSSSNEDKIIVFPLLNKLELRHLTNFKCFSSQRNLDIELPSCEEMVIEKCPNMTSFCYGDVKTPKLLQIYKGSYEYVDLMVDLNATIHCANKNFKVPQQTLERSRFIEQDHHLLDYLRSQTELFVEDSETLLHCVPFNMFHRFQHIKQLKVRECGSIVEIFESKSNGDDDDDDEGYCCTKTFYNYNMQELHLYALPKLMHIWRENHGRILTFGNLRKLKIGFCGGLKSLLSPSIARGLSQLQEFSVHECEELEKIISDEESIHNVKIIEFPSLQWLTLYQLPSLGCFCSSSYHFELPSCHDIIIKECPKIEACCKGITKTFQN